MCEALMCTTYAAAAEHPSSEQKLGNYVGNQGEQAYEQSTLQHCLQPQIKGQFIPSA